VARSLDAYLGAFANARQFSGVVLIARNGKPLFRRAYGSADVARHIPNTPETRFMIFSMTKQFTAAAILLLQQRGMLDVHDPVNRYLPDFPAEWSEVTIHDLLTHTSGLTYDDLARWLKSRMEPAHPADRGFRPPKTTPGRVMEYSNPGYVTLGLVVSAVSGKSYQEFLAANIFRPLHMMHTGCDHPGAVPGRARGYYLDGDQLRVGEQSTAMIVGAGDIYSTMDDLLRWDAALYTDRLLSAASRRAMFTCYIEHYGYGWFIETDDGAQVYEHGGLGAGFCSTIHRYPQSKTTVIVLSNMNLPDDSDFDFQDIFDAAFGEKLDAPRIAFVPESVRLRYVGVYRTGRRNHEIVQLNSRLRDNTTGQELRPVSATEFATENDVLYRFRVENSGQRGTLTIREAKRTWSGSKVQLHPVRRQQYAGVYQMRDGTKARILGGAGNMLMLELAPTVHIKLIPLTDTTFSLQDTVLMLDFHRKRSGTIDALTVVNGSHRVHMVRR
jgi:CubicO group peptidase (beta-lactamase class C family)